MIMTLVAIVLLLISKKIDKFVQEEKKLRRIRSNYRNQLRDDRVKYQN